MQTKHLCVLIHIWIKGEVGLNNILFNKSQDMLWKGEVGVPLNQGSELQCLLKVKEDLS